MRMRRLSSAALCVVALLAATLPAAASPTDAGLPSVASSCGTHVRWVITAARVPGGEGIIQAADVALYDAGVPLPNWSDDPDISVTNPGGAGSDPEYGEGPEKAYDGRDDTKWLDFAFGVDAESTLLIVFPEPVTFDSYAWTTGNDAPWRDPISWRVEVSPDGVAWTTIDTRSDVAVPEVPFSDVGPFGVTASGCGSTGRDFGGGRSGVARSGPGENREGVLALDPRSRGRVR